MSQVSGLGPKSLLPCKQWEIFWLLWKGRLFWIILKRIANVRPQHWWHGVDVVWGRTCLPHGHLGACDECLWPDGEHAPSPQTSVRSTWPLLFSLLQKPFLQPLLNIFPQFLEFLFLTGVREEGLWHLGSPSCPIFCGITLIPRGFRA